jgi:hypothetical protein
MTEKRAIEIIARFTLTTIENNIKYPNRDTPLEMYALKTLGYINKNKEDKK